jgi:hypothetical protein
MQSRRWGLADSFGTWAPGTRSALGGCGNLLGGLLAGMVIETVAARATHGCKTKA